MRAEIVVAVLAVGRFMLGESALYADSVEQKLRILEAQVKLVDDLLIEECPFYLRSGREVAKNHPAHLEVQKILYDRLLSELIECRSQKKKRKTTSTAGQEHTTKMSTLVTEQTMVIQDTSKQTAVNQLTSEQTTEMPSACLTAVNYTEAWRRDLPKSRTSYACDLASNSSDWFRFAGPAGHQLLNKCPKIKSCGTYAALWTDVEMPKTIGKETIIKVYSSGLGGCKGGRHNVKVMRCSIDTPHDLIYKQTTNYQSDRCNEAFCGMP